MTRHLEPRWTTRRRVLAAGGAAFAGLTAGCSGLPGIGSGSARKTDWPQFQFDTANTGFTSVRGPTGGVTARWSVETDALRMYFQPAFVQDTLYIGGHSRGDENSFYAFDGDTGEEKWRVDGLLGPSGPAVADGTVYFGVGRPDSGALLALDEQTGAEEWRADTGGETSAPTVANGAVYAGGRLHDYFAARDAETGEELWRYQFDNNVTATPAVDGGTVYLGDMYGPWADTYTVVALNAETGDKRWQFEHGGMVASPVVGDDHVYIADLGGEIHALSTAGGDRHWHRSIESPIQSTPALAEGTLYIPGNDLLAFDADTGDLVWRAEDFSPQSTDPVVAGETVYVTGTKGSVHAVDVESGQKQWTFEMVDAISAGEGQGGTSPIVTDGTVFVAGLLGTVFALEEA